MARNDHHTSHKPSATRPNLPSLLIFLPLHVIHFITQRLPFFLRWPIRFVGNALLLAASMVILIAVLYGLRARPYDMGKLNEMPERSIILDKRGQEIGRLHGEKRDIIRLDQVSPAFRKAIIAREDERFYQHGAFDVIGMVRAAINNARGKREGASTISQQLASDVFKLKDYGTKKTTLQLLDRKLLEIALAVRIEHYLGSKDKVLECYVNSINWGRSIRGIQEASRIYFEKPAAQLNLAEAAMLAGIVRGPDAFNPFHNLAAALRERDTTLDRMVDAKAISLVDAQQAKLQEINIRPQSRRQAHESYAVDAIRRDLEMILEQENIELGGLTIVSTIDHLIQERAEQSVDQGLLRIENSSGYPHLKRARWQSLPDEKKPSSGYLQGAAVVIDHRTGAILAMVGGRNADESRFNRANQAQRQIGSIFKPFVYLAAFDRGLSQQQPISDDPIAPGEIKGAPRQWRPGNSDGQFTGMHPAAYGLIRSRNTMSLRVGNYAGIPRVREVARQAGFQRELPSNPACFLGAWEATPLEVASAYSMLPNGGLRFRPFLIAQIKDRQGNVLYSTAPLSYQAASPQSAWQVSNILQQVTTVGTAAAVKRLGFDAPCAGKTGTTNDFKDAWFAGYTSALTCVVWSGLDEPRKTISGGYGATISLPIWVEIMKTADRLGYRALAFTDQAPSSSPQISCDICRDSGKRATRACWAAHTAENQQLPLARVPPLDDLCPLHPEPISEETAEAAPRALPVLEDEDEPGAAPRAVPVE